MGTKHTSGEWRLVYDAQGPCMIMHPAQKGVAIASLTDTFNSVNGFVGDEQGDNWPEERNANAILIWAAPKMLVVLRLVEWSGVNSYGLPSCPICYGKRGINGHYDDCQLHTAIVAATEVADKEKDDQYAT